MKVLIIEDSRLARQGLKNLLASFPDIEIIGEAEDGALALKLIQELRPDLLFLDIHLPVYNGFEVLEKLDLVPQVIFTTAFDEYAIQSFEYNTIDYLLKPIEIDRLKKAVTKAMQQLNPLASDLMDEHSQVFVKDGEKCWFVTLKDIYLFESYGNYTRVYFENNKPLIHKSLAYLESKLDPKVFFRANRQQMINMKHVAGVASWFNGKLKLRLKDNSEVEVSRRQSNKIRERFSF